MNTKTNSWDGWQDRFLDALQDYKGDKSDGKLATEFNVSRQAVGHWRTGIRSPELSNFFRVCKKIEVDPAVILFGKPIAFANQMASRIAALEQDEFEAVMVALEGAEARNLRRVQKKAA